VLSSISSKISRLIEQSDSVLLHLHPSPDGDSIGSTLAFYHYLQSLNKRVDLIRGDSDSPQNFSTLPGFEQIIPKNYFQIDPSSYQLFIICDTSSLNQISKLQEVTIPSGLQTINIDHHATNSLSADVNLVDTSSPSTCQIVYQLFRKLKITITPQIAINLFVGLYTDSLFKYSKTSSKTFQAAAFLTKICPNFPQIIFNIENNSEPEQLKFRGLALTKIENYFGGKLAISVVSHQHLLKNRISRRHTEKADISNLLKSVVGWDIGASLVENEPGICNLSMRTRDPQKYDLSQICSATGFGGGHPAAAGATIYQNIQKAKQTLLTIISHLHPELGQP